MEIKLERSTNRNDEESQTLYIDGKQVERIYSLSESPEDAIIGRNLIDGDDIIYYMQKAYKAGKDGEELNIQYSKEDEE